MGLKSPLSVSSFSHDRLADGMPLGFSHSRTQPSSSTGESFRECSAGELTEDETVEVFDSALDVAVDDTGVLSVLDNRHVAVNDVVAVAADVSADVSADVAADVFADVAVAVAADVAVAFATDVAVDVAVDDAVSVTVDVADVAVDEAVDDAVDSDLINSNK